jgi:hypothetical protein
MSQEETAIAEPAVDAEPVTEEPANPTTDPGEGAADDESKRTRDDDAKDDDEAKRAKTTTEGDGAEAVAEAASDPVKLGPVTFNSGDEMMLWFSHLRAENTLNQNLNEYEAAVVEACIRQGHDTPDVKLGCGVKCFQVRMHPSYRVRTLMVVRTDSTMEDFSYRKCVAKLFPGYDPSTFSNSALAIKGASKWNDGRFGGGGRSGGRGRGGRDGGRSGGRGGGGRGGGRGGPDRGGDRFGGGGRGGGGRGGGGDKPRFGRPY